MGKILIQLIASICIIATISAVDLRSQPGVATVADAENQFAIDLYKQCAKALPGKNLVFSPFSISTALALTQLGARGATAQQMASTLRWPSTQAPPLNGYENYLTVLQDETTSEKSGYLLSSAQRVYVSNKLTLQANFTAAARQYFKADAQSANFLGNAEGERKNINDWVTVQTRNKIRDLLPSGSVDPSTALLLIQALYFKGSWLHKFDAEATADDVFHTATGDVKVKLMSHYRHFKYARGTGYSAVELPYGKTNGSENADVSMLIVLPNANNGVEEVASRLTADSLKHLKASLYSVKVSLKLPRFSVDSTLSLKEALSSLGMVSAFSGSADFSGMIVEPASLQITGVVHKAVVQVNEEGAEAAAATGIIVGVTSVEEAVEFNVNHPFLFYIIDNRAGNILFLGRVLTPN